MGKGLTEQQIEQYHQDGFFAPIAVLSDTDAARMRRAFESYERANGGWYELSKGQKLYLLQTWMAELVSNPSILDAVEDVLGPDIMCWGTSLFVKDANTPHFVSWHQDSTYWGLSKPNVVTAWVALSPANAQSGCMSMLPGSHRWEQAPHQDTLDPNNLLSRGQEIAVDVDESQAVMLPLTPGEVSLHNIRTAHASSPNQTDDRRIGVAIRYISPDVQQTIVPNDSAWLVRGEDRFGHFEHETPPNADMDEAALAEHHRIMALRQGVLYRGVDGQPAHTTLGVDGT